MPKNNKCPQNKQSFQTQEQCDRWIEYWNETRKPNQSNLGYSYLCKHCLTWHATSQTKPENVDPDEIISLLYDQKEFIKFLCEELNHKGYNQYKQKLRARYGKLIAQNWTFITRLRKLKEKAIENVKPK